MRLLVIIGVFCCSGIPVQGCTWINDGSCYTLFEAPEEKMTQNEANDICIEELGGYLVSITSEEEQNYLVERFWRHFEVTENMSIWTGGYCDDENQLWKWASDEKFEYTAWNDGKSHDLCQQPNAILMVYLADGTSDWYRWWEEDHDKPRRFLCESKI